MKKLVIASILALPLPTLGLASPQKPLASCDNPGGLPAFTVHLNDVLLSGPSRHHEPHVVGKVTDLIGPIEYGDSVQTTLSLAPGSYLVHVSGPGEQDQGISGIALWDSGIDDEELYTSSVKVITSAGPVLTFEDCIIDFNQIDQLNF